MNTKRHDVIAAEIDELVTIGQNLSRDAAQARSSLGPERIEELSAITSRGGQLIRRLYGQDSQYLENLNKLDFRVTALPSHDQSVSWSSSLIFKQA